MEPIHKRPVAAVVGADTTYIDIVQCAGVEAHDVDRVVVDTVDKCARTDGEAGRAVLHFVFTSDSGRPGDSSIGLGDIASNDIAHTRAGGRTLNSHIVNVGIPRTGGTVGAKCDILASAEVGIKRYLEELPIGGVGHIDRAHTLEGADVLRVCHHTHSEYRAIGGAARTRPEGELQGVDRRYRSIHTGHDDNLVVAIGASGGGVIPVEAFGTAWCMVVGRATHIRITVIGGAIVETVHAVDERCTRAGARGCALEGLRERQCDASARGLHRNDGGHAGVGAVGRDADLVSGVGTEACEGVAGSRLGRR